MSRCNSSFWLYNIKDLFCSLQIIPTTHMTKPQKFNALTRLVLILFLILWCIDFRLALIFLILSLIIIIILYCLQRKPMTDVKENFINSYDVEYIKTPQNLLPPQSFRKIKLEPIQEFTLYSPQQNTLCNDGVGPSSYQECINPEETPKNELESLIQYNPLLRDDPVTRKNRPKFEQILYQPPMFDTEAWADNDFTYLPGINREGLRDDGASGYHFETDKCGFITCDMECKKKKPLKENFVFEPSESYYPNIQQNYEHIRHNRPPNNCLDINQNLPGNIDTSMGYYPKQNKRYNLPVNLDMGQGI